MPLEMMNDALHKLVQRRRQESIYLFTFHKCASTLFGNYILKNIKGLKHRNYATDIYLGKKMPEQIRYYNHGYAYGPIRLSADPDSPVYEKFVHPVSSESFISDKIAIFFVRDPRDILVSAYYSFGFTHGDSPVESIRQKERNTRLIIQNMTLDDYVLNYADQLSVCFDRLLYLNSVCSRSVILCYEDLIDDYDKFIGYLCRYVKLTDEVIEETYNRSRPRKNEDESQHKRSGKPGGFRAKLKNETIIQLDYKFACILDHLY